MSETYDAVILVPVKIPAKMVESASAAFSEYDDLEDEVLQKAAIGLQDFITEFRAEYRRG